MSSLPQSRPTTRRVLVSVVLTVIAVYLGLVAVLFLLQPRLVYFPTRQIVATPNPLHLPYDPVAFRASDGTRLTGWFLRHKSPRGVVLFCHGNAGNISHRLESIQILLELRLSVFIFDYRGYGESEGKPSERGTYLDADAAWRHLVEERQVPPAQIVLFGRSLGGAIAAWLATEHTPKALILESTFTSVPDLGARLYPFLPVRLISRFRYNTRDYVRQVKCPVLVVHSPDDEIIPFAHGREIFEAANEPKEFLQISGSHNDGFLATGQRYVAGLDAFLSKHLAK